MEVKIIQLLFEANPHDPNQSNTKRLLGLGDDGKVYWYNGSKWDEYYV